MATYYLPLPNKHIINSPFQKETSNNQLPNKPIK